MNPWSWIADRHKQMGGAKCECSIRFQGRKTKGRQNKIKKKKDLRRMCKGFANKEKCSGLAFDRQNNTSLFQRKKDRLAEDGFDPSTSGLWAQHAPAAPLCCGWCQESLQVIVHTVAKVWHENFLFKVFLSNFSDGWSLVTDFSENLVDQPHGYVELLHEWVVP